jgi:hypothetical protein
LVRKRSPSTVMAFPWFSRAKRHSHCARRGVNGKVPQFRCSEGAFRIGQQRVDSRHWECRGKRFPAGSRRYGSRRRRLVNPWHADRDQACGAGFRPPRPLAARMRQRLKSGRRGRLARLTHRRRARAGARTARPSENSAGMGWGVEDRGDGPRATLRLSGERRPCTEAAACDSQYAHSTDTVFMDAEGLA